MNALQESIAELRRAGDRLMISLGAYKTVGRSGGRPSILSFDGIVWDGKKGPLPPRHADLKYAINILRSSIRGVLPLKAELDLIARVLNQSPIELDAVMQDGRVCLRRSSNRFRFVVEDLVGYVNLLDPRLKSYEPIGVCMQCDGIFMKRRTDQLFCSSACRSESWAAKTGKVYFAERARESRKRRRS
jgi:hypothetical protein